MGLSLANAFVEEGADVTLVMGPVQYEVATGMKLIRITSAIEMFEAAKKAFREADIAVFAAAVADFRPVETKDYKIKEKQHNFSIDLTPNPDIAYELGKIKKTSQLTVGFALETNEGVAEAIAKKKKKNFDLIILNSLKDPGAGFGVDTNRITLIAKDNKARRFELKSKTDVARDILDSVAHLVTE